MKCLEGVSQNGTLTFPGCRYFAYLSVFVTPLLILAEGKRVPDAVTPSAELRNSAKPSADAIG